MDPLSIVAASIAIIGATGEAFNIAEKAWDLRHRDEELMGLWNHIKGSYCELLSVKSALDQIRSGTAATVETKNCLESIKKICEQVITDLGGLTKTLQDTGLVGTDKPSKRKWLQNKAKLVRLKERLQNLEKLSRAIILQQNTQILMRMNVTETAIVALRGPIDQITHHLDQNSSHGSPGSNNPITTGPESRRSSIATFHSSATKQDDRSTNIFSIIPEPSAEECKAWCRCQCHTVTRTHPLRWIKHLVGNIAFYGNGSILLNRRECSWKGCRRSGSGHVQLIYRAPEWVPTAFNVYIRADITPKICISPHKLTVIRNDALIWSIVELGNVVKLREMLTEGSAGPYDMTNEGISVLKWAALRGQYDAYECLLQAQADPYFSDQSGMMAYQPGLDWALCNSFTSTGPPKSYGLFVTRENLDQQDFSFLHRIILDIEHMDLEDALRLMQKMPFDIDLVDINGRSPLLWAAWRGNTQAVNRLIEYGANVNQSDAENFTPLAKASKAGHLECVRSLLRAEAIIHAVTSGNAQPIHLASENGDSGFEVVKELISHGADLNAKGNDGGTPLHSAANRGSIKTVEWLVTKGAEIDAVDNQGVTPAMMALLCWNEPTFMFLAKSGARLDLVGLDSVDNIIHYATWCGTTAAMQFITDASKQGSMDFDCTKVLHEGHDIFHCFGKCRDLWFKETEGNPRQSDEWSVFQKMIGHSASVMTCRES